MIVIYFLISSFPIADWKTASNNRKRSRWFSDQHGSEYQLHFEYRLHRVNGSGNWQFQCIRKQFPYQIGWLYGPRAHLAGQNSPPLLLLLLLWIYLNCAEGWADAACIPNWLKIRIRFIRFPLPRSTIFVQNVNDILSTTMQNNKIFLFINSSILLFLFSQFGISSYFIVF